MAIRIVRPKKGYKKIIVDVEDYDKDPMKYSLMVTRRTSVQVVDRDGKVVVGIVI